MDYLTAELGGSKRSQLRRQPHTHQERLHVHSMQPAVRTGLGPLGEQT